MIKKVIEAATGTVNKEEIFEMVASVVCGFLTLEVGVLHSKSRIREVVYARQLFVFFCRQLLPSVTLREIGERVNCTHATVMHSITNIKNLCDTDDSHLYDVTTISRILRLSLEEIGIETRDQESYCLNLNECISAKMGTEKAVVLIGYSEHEINMILRYISGGDESIKHRKHLNTGLFLLHESKSKIV